MVRFRQQPFTKRQRRRQTGSIERQQDASCHRRRFEQHNPYCRSFQAHLAGKRFDQERIPRTKDAASEHQVEWFSAEIEFTHDSCRRLPQVLTRLTNDPTGNLVARICGCEDQRRESSVGADRKSTRLNSSHASLSRMPSSA